MSSFFRGRRSGSPGKRGRLKAPETEKGARQPRDANGKDRPGPEESEKEPLARMETVFTERFFLLGEMEGDRRLVGKR